MRKKFSNLRWVAGALLTILFVSGCITRPPEDKMRVGDYQFHCYDLDPSAGPTDFSPDNYYYKWVYTAPDGTRYERIEFYITDPDGTSKHKCEWHVRRILLAAARAAGKNGDYEEYGWYTCITHPPDSAGTIEQGVVICITHPPDVNKTVPSK